MTRREARDRKLPAERVLARGERLLAHNGLTDLQAIRADLQLIGQRSFARPPRKVPAKAAVAKARGLPRAGGPALALTEVTRGPAAAAVPGFADARVPDSFGGMLARRGFVRMHGPWHAVHNADRLSPAQLALVEQTLGWKAPRDAAGRLIKQEGMVENGYKFLGMHSIMVQAAEQAGVAQGVIRPFTQQEWARLKPAIERQRPAVARGMQMMMDMLAAYDAAGTGSTAATTDIGTLFGGTEGGLDIFGNWLQTTQRSEANIARLPRLTPAQRKSFSEMAGLHNVVHVALADSASEIDMGNPEVNLYNQLFWLHHGTIEAARKVYLEWYATPADRAAYAKVEGEERSLMNPGSAQGQRMLESINRVDARAKSFDGGERKLWRGILDRISPAATLADPAR